VLGQAFNGHWPVCTICHIHEKTEQYLEGKVDQKSIKMSTYALILLLRFVIHLVATNPQQSLIIRQRFFDNISDTHAVSAHAHRDIS